MSISNSSLSPSSSSSSDTRLKRPSQIKFFRPAQMALFANLITYPPLAQVSVIPPSRKEVRISPSGLGMDSSVAIARLITYQAVVLDF